MRPSLRRAAITSFVLLVSWAPPSAQGQLVPSDPGLTRPFGDLGGEPTSSDPDPLSDPGLCLTLTPQQLRAAARGREVRAERAHTCGHEGSTPAW